MSDQTNRGLIHLQEPISAISVVIPCKNEEKAVGQTISDTRQALEGLSLNFEIIVVDDGSSDATAQEALDNGAMVLSHPINQGYGNAIMNGISVARYPVIAIMDADGTYPIDMLPKMIEMVGSHDMVVGQRIWERHNTARANLLFRKILAYIIYYFTSVRSPDFNSGFRVFHKLDILSYRPLLCPTFSFTTSLTLIYLLLHRSVCFVPIDYSTRVGSSKVSLLRDAIRTFAYVFLITNLFQPYRLVLIFLAMAVVMNLLIMLAGSMAIITTAMQIYLQISASTFVLICVAGLLVMPLTKIYQQMFISKQTKN
ncbi:MAG: glycosyltransferase family 2 protein [Pseudomonadota bacterium]